MLANGPARTTLAANEIPIFDLTPLRSGDRAAMAAVARDLRRASTEVGFYYVRNHGIGQELIDGVFHASERFHGLPINEKQALAIDRHKIGYFEVESTLTRHSALAEGTRPNLYAAFCVRKDLAPDDPDVMAGKLFRGLNRWPAGLPAFRETVLRYNQALEDLARGMLPLYAMALDLPENYFDAAFTKPLTNLQLNYYPHQERFDGDQFGIAPHTDRGFITILAQAKITGLEIRTLDERWVQAPVLPGHFLINTGDLLRFWTNNLFLSTPHRVINVSNLERHSIPFFFNPDPEALIECLPTCQSADNPPKNPPIRYGDFYEWFVRQNYKSVVDAIGASAAPTPPAP
jgi:isopenicillin N synthase-like dioxygenase